MIPSLLQIPSAVSDSKLHSVLPNNGKGDFTFDRSTGATRINKDGLIEEVGYFSSELVQNGNFSELGSELVTNGDFSSTSDWTITNNTGTATEIINGYVRIKTDGTYTQIRQFNVLTIGKTYKLVYDVIESDEGSLGLEIGGSTLLIPSTVGTHTFYWVSNSTTFNIKRYGGALDIKIDNVSVKQVDPNNRWTLQSGWSYGTNKVTSSNTANIFFQTISFVTGKKYKLKFDLLDYSSGQLLIQTNARTLATLQANGSYEYIFDATTDTELRFNGSDSNTITVSVTNISIVEVQGDRPRLSYDITNGVVEDKPHLLLEPSSTNEITFSKDFTQFNNKPDVTITTGFTAPDGTNTATKVIKTGSNAHIAAYAGINTGKRKSIYARTVSGTGKVTLLNVQSDTNALFDLTEEWQRFDITHSGADFFYAVDFRNTGATLTEVLIWGAQLENLSYATSLIPTAGTTITRAAETSFLHNIDDGILNQSGFTLFLDTNLLNDTVNNFRDIIALYNTAGSITMRLETRTNGQVYIQQTGVVSSGDNFNSATFGSNSVNFKKFAISCSTSEVQLWADGNKINDYSGSYVFTFDKLGFRGNDSVVETILKHKGVAIYNEALSESQLMQLTGVTASSIYSNFVTRTASFTVEALNEVKKVIDNL